MKEKQSHLPNEVMKMENLTINVLNRAKINENISIKAILSGEFRLLQVCTVIL